MIELRSEIKAAVTSAILRTPGAEPELVIAQFDDALREFTRNSLAWALPREMVTVTGQRDYMLPAPHPGAVPTWVLTVENSSGRPLPMQNRLASDSTTGPPSSFMCPSPGALRLFPTPAASFELKLIVAFAATSHEAPLPPWFISLYQDTLVDGTLHRVYAMPNTPFSNIRLAEFHGRRFRSGVASARISVERGLSRSVPPSTWGHS